MEFTVSQRVTATRAFSSSVKPSAGGGATKKPSLSLRRLLPALFFLPLCFAGCTLPFGKTEPVTPDRAFITYTPGARDPGTLRLAVKDLIDMKGQVTTAGSQYVAETAPPAERDAACLAAARRSNVQIVGKTNLTEFALGTSGMNEYFGTPVNPLDRRRIPGGSSSGSAVAVANGEADVAFGSDTAGSIRVPAACCGILGLKTTFGLVPLDGVFPLSPKHLDTIGPMAKDVPHLVQGMELLSPGFSARYEAAKARKSTAGEITIGRLYIDGTDPRIDRALDHALTTTGFRVVALNEHRKTEWEKTEAGFRVFRPTDRFQAQWNQAQSDGTTIAITDGWLSDRKYLNKPGVSLVTQAAIRLGDLQNNTAYKEALKGKAAWQKTLRRVLDQVDLIALPTLQTPPVGKPFFGRTAIFEARVLSLQNTVAVNYAGNPAIAIPVPLKGGGFPVTSLQLIGPNNGEAELINAARLIMNAAP
jgi:Asp-tRNA(Asn)/Glu-tRNA(Gln) amidotransferase A subunit family amidase